jgi:flagellar hook-length control protein FliK
MSIEFSKTSQEPKSVGTTACKKPGKLDVPGSAVPSGFMALMSLLSSVDNGGDAVVPADDAVISSGALPDAGAGQALPFLATNPWVQLPLSAQVPQDTTSKVGMQLGVIGTIKAGTPLGEIGTIGTVVSAQDMTATQASMGTAVQPKPVDVLNKSGFSVPGGIATDVGKAESLEQKGDVFLVNLVPTQTVTDVAVPTQLRHKSADQAQTLSAIQIELRDVKGSTALTPIVPVHDAGIALVVGGSGDPWTRPNDHVGTKSASGQSGTGVDGAFGTAFVGAERDRAVFEVSATSAVVPEAGLAETVSYWAAQGVQNAELKLDGFGGDPVEVSISLNGDQAQIEFRTDQVDVRQAIEGATAHLKELLLSEGLQLTGVWVGASGSGNTPGDGSQQRQGAKHAAFVKTHAVEQTGSVVTNHSVGRSLDVFV